MIRYILKRFVAAFITALMVITITFFLMHAVPGNPFLGEDTARRPEVVEKMMARYELDKPIIIQFKNYIFNLLRGDFGISLKTKLGEEITTIIAKQLPISAHIGIIAFLIPVGIGIPMGTLAALRAGRPSDRAIIVMCALGVAVPGFVLATVFMYTFGVKLKLVPFIGLTNWKAYILPIICLCLGPTAFLTRLTRTNMHEVLNQDYIKTARAKGLRSGAVLFRHALRNAIIPVVTYLGPQMIGILTGSFVIERIFTIPGLAKYFVEAIPGRDYPVIMAITIIFGTLLITVNFVIDILYGIIDPRIKT